MPLFANSYEGLGELMVLMWIWPLAAGLALVAFSLFLAQSATRFASMGGCQHGYLSSQLFAYRFAGTLCD